MLASDRPSAVDSRLQSVESERKGSQGMHRYFSIQWKARDFSKEYRQLEAMTHGGMSGSSASSGQIAATMALSARAECCCGNKSGR